MAAPAGIDTAHAGSPGWSWTRHQGCAPVCGAGLRGRAEVKFHAGRQPDQVCVQVNVGPAGWLTHDVNGVARPQNLREVAVVPESAQRGAQSRIDVAVGERGGLEGDSQQVGEDSADHDGCPLRRFDAVDLSPGIEAVAGRGYLIEHAISQILGLAQRSRIRDHQTGRR